VTIKFDPAQHTSVGEVAEAAAWKLDQGKVPQVRLALFRVSDEAAKPSCAQCNAAVDDPSSKIDLSISLKAEANRDATLRDEAWFVLKISSPAAAPAAGEFRADAPGLAPVVLPGAGAAVSPPLPPPNHVVLCGSVLSRLFAPVLRAPLEPDVVPTVQLPLSFRCARLLCCRRWRSCRGWSRCW